MLLGIDPKVDYAFKHLFGRDATRPILIDVIDAVLDAGPDRRIRDIELLNPFNPKEAFDDKLSILDIKARDQSGRQFNIEMQMLASPAYEKRILYYGARLHQQQLHEGEDYPQLQPTISITFLDDILFPQATAHHLRFRLLEESLRFAMTDDLEFHILELPKFTKGLAELASDLDIWLYFLRHAAMMNKDDLPAQLQKPLVQRAWEDLKMLSEAEIERERYEARWKAKLDHNSFVSQLRKLEEFQKRYGDPAELEKALESLENQEIGMIRFCERLLNQPETPTEQLAVLSVAELSRLAEEMQKKAMTRP